MGSEVEDSQTHISCRTTARALDSNRSYSHHLPPLLDLPCPLPPPHIPNTTQTSASSSSRSPTSSSYTRAAGSHWPLLLTSRGIEPAPIEYYSLRQHISSHT